MQGFCKNKWSVMIFLFPMYNIYLLASNYDEKEKKRKIGTVKGIKQTETYQSIDTLRQNSIKSATNMTIKR